MMSGWYHQGWGWGGIVMMFLFMLVFWGGLAAVLVAVLRPGHRDAPPPATPSVGPPAAPDAKSILDERFARGEIDADEYRQRVGVLKGS